MSFGKPNLEKVFGNGKNALRIMNSCAWCVHQKSVLQQAKWKVLQEWFVVNCVSITYYVTQKKFGDFRNFYFSISRLLLIARIRKKVVFRWKAHQGNISERVFSKGGGFRTFPRRLCLTITQSPQHCKEKDEWGLDKKLRALDDAAFCGFANTQFRNFGIYIGDGAVILLCNHFKSI